LEPVLRLAKPAKKIIADKTFWQAKDYFFHNTPTDRFKVKSVFVQKTLPEQGIEELLGHVASRPGSSNEDGGFAMFALGGAISRIPKEDTAYVHRDARFLLAIDSSWASSDSGRTEQENIDWVEEFADSMRPYTSEYAYQNFIDRSQANSAHAYYGENLDRLVHIKRLRDPEYFFHFVRACRSTWRPSRRDPLMNVRGGLGPSPLFGVRTPRPLLRVKRCQRGYEGLESTLVGLFDNPGASREDRVSAARGGNALGHLRCDRVPCAAWQKLDVHQEVILKEDPAERTVGHDAG
jgi:hypothetical protein